jgi:hypothetical protein
MFRRTQEVLNQARRTREQSQRLCSELREAVARSLVVLWHSRGQRQAPPASANDLITRAERAKRSRETVVRNPDTPAGPP